MIAPTCFGPPGPSCNFSKVRHRLPDYDGPGGPKHVGAIMR